jgi:hypothetical protein
VLSTCQDPPWSEYAYRLSIRAAITLLRPSRGGILTNGF